MTSPAPLVTAREILDKTTAFFAGKSIPTARLDAEVLLAHVVGYDRLRLYLNLDRPLSAEEVSRARELVRRRAAREPVAYILGQKEFAGRTFRVAPGVLIPRPDTELLTEHAAAWLLEHHGASEEPLRALEFGVGSGAIAVTLAADIPNLHMTATEILPAAAEIAGQNAAAHGVADRVDIRVQPDFAGLSGPFHALISNPPYIAPEETADLAPDVRDYEPHEALFAEDNGLRWYRWLAREAPPLLIPGGLLAVEIGYTQADAVKEIFESAGFTSIQIQKDYAGHNRVVMGIRP